jgi:mRNA interferase MazF
VPEPTRDLSSGEVVWVEPDPTVGREQSGRRPALVVAGSSYLQMVDSLALIVPITTVDRGWPNHVPILDVQLPHPSWAMSEQIRTVSRERIVGRAGRVDDGTLATVREWISDFLEL